MDKNIKVAFLAGVAIVAVACLLALSRRTSATKVPSSCKAVGDDNSSNPTDSPVKPRSSAESNSKGRDSSSPLTTRTGPLTGAAGAEGPSGSDLAASPQPAGDRREVSREVVEGDEKKGADGGLQAAGEGAGEDDEQNVLDARFNTANSLARKYMKAERYPLAIEQYSVALSLCDRLPEHEDKRTALHNNRGAAYEKSGKYAQALAECDMCLAREQDHPLARVRKSRVLEALGKPVDALNEVCAHLMLERDRFPGETRPPPANLENLLQKVTMARVDQILAERAETAKRVEAGEAIGEDRSAKRQPKPVPKQIVLELLRSFGSFAEIERDYKGKLESVFTIELEHDCGESSPASRVSNYFERFKIRLVKHNFEGAREDVFEAAGILSKLGVQSGEEVPPDVRAGVWEWQGTFLQLESNQDGALQAYERSCLVHEINGTPCSTDVLIKLAWVFMDKEDPEEAEKYFNRAMEAAPDYSSCCAHKARLCAETEGPEVARGYVEQALKINEKDVFAWEQMVKLHIQTGDVLAAVKAIEEALENIPKSAPLLIVKAELMCSLAVRMNDTSQGVALMNLFEEAVQADPSNPIIYLNKAAFAVQLMQDIQGATEMVKRALELDPRCVPAMVQLANLKIQTAKTLDEGEAAADVLRTAVEMCYGREDLAETLSVLVAAEARMEGAKLIGRFSLA